MRLTTLATEECRRAAFRVRRDSWLDRLTHDELDRLVAGILLGANNPLPYDASVIAAVNAFTALLNSGFLRIYTGAQPALNGAITGTQLASLTFSATAFPTAVAAAGTVTATANAITSGTAGATGTAGYHGLLKSDGTTIVATGSVGLSASDLNLNTLSITNGNTVSCSSYLITMPET